MKKLLFAALVGLFLSSSAQAEEVILDYNSDITVNADSSLDVTEHIKVVSAGSEIRHGIYRDFPTQYKDKNGKIRKAEFEITNTKRDGGYEAYHTQNIAGGKRVYLGSSNILLPSGVHEYDIRYHTSGWMRYFDKYDELYWNVTGNGWNFPINQASATIHLPSGATVTQLAAYTGREGEKGTDYGVFTDQSSNYVFQTTRKLHVHEGLTVAVGFPKGFVTEVVAAEPNYFHDNLGEVIALIAFIITAAYYYSSWNKVGRDPKKGTIIPLFSPPDNLSPAECAYLTNVGWVGGNSNRNLTAAIVNMAVKGYLTITEKGSKSYTLSKISDDTSSLSADEKAIANSIFIGKEEIQVGRVGVAEVSPAFSEIARTIKSGDMTPEQMKKILSSATSSSFLIRKALSEMSKTLSDKWKGKGFTNNLKYISKGILLSLLVLVGVFIQIHNSDGIAGLVINGQDYQTDTAFIFIAIWSIPATGALYAFISIIRKAINGQKKMFGITIFTLLFVIGFTGLGLYMLYKIGQSVGMLTSVIMFSTYLLNFIMPSLLKAPTELGRALMDKIEGFKMYLDVAEKNQLNILTPPEVTPEVFEKYLPYAIALDLEQQWGDKFANQLQTGTNQNYQPLWYSGSGFAAYGFGGFASNLSSGISSSISSSTSGGSSGGGSSGGGGGGGGGGGW